MNTQNYPTWLVPLYIAKELKEIGFNEKCAFLCTLSDRIGFTLNTNKGHYHYLEEVNNDNHNGRGMLSVPIWTQVFAWFKKHYYHVNIDDKGTWIHWSFYNEMIEPPILENEPQDGWETDYYEALEALVVALIKTYKSEQKQGNNI